MVIDLTVPAWMAKYAHTVGWSRPFAFSEGGLMESDTMFEGERDAMYEEKENPPPHLAVAERAADAVGAFYERLRSGWMGTQPIAPYELTREEIVQLTIAWVQAGMPMSKDSL